MNVYKTFALLVIFLSPGFMAHQLPENGPANNTSYKEEVARKVLDRLVEARGDKRMQKPTFHFTKEPQYVAAAIPHKAMIFLEEPAYDVCRSFGKDSLNALAALLAHEVTHYYEKHDWEEYFVKAFSKTMSVQSVEEDTDAHSQDEIQADYLGGFLAHSAGFQVMGLMPKLLVKVYEAYELPEQLPGYPSLAEREKMAEISQKKLKELLQVYEMAGYMASLGLHERAVDYYKFILRDYQSREIYNNIGVSYFLASMDYFTKKEVKYGYPVELDIESRLVTGTKGTRGYGTTREEIRRGYLTDAIEHFEVAFELDKNYAPALLNKACAKALLAIATDDEDLKMEYFDEAKLLAGKARRLASRTKNKKVALDADVIEGIVSATRGDEEEAVVIFGKAKEKGSHLAAMNLTILNGLGIEAVEASTMSLSVKPESIEDFSLNKYLFSATVDEKTEIDKKTLLGVKESEFNGSKLLFHFINSTGEYLVIHQTKEDYKGTTNAGIGIGSDRDAIIGSYGKPDRVMELATGELLIYEKKFIIFTLDDEGKLMHWCVFRLQLPNEG